ncbi:hypothetical protein NQ315_016834 [Exocentrus adspersus]|uniref:Uncharacterized protein n=1 Tax=Exocentrus adspersus TaxID=1586481 RepID=A0AAV8VX51_9CUCU|nr:hypothetical protein NQ315_016834 [Exocentrus adspersus]
MKQFEDLLWTTMRMVMSLPVSQYEALLAEVRDLRRKAQRVQQLARPLLQENLSPSPPPGTFTRIPRPRSPPDTRTRSQQYACIFIRLKLPKFTFTGD